MYLNNNLKIFNLGYKSVHTNGNFIYKCFPKDYFNFINDNLENNIINEFALRASQVKYGILSRAFALI